MKRKRTKPKGKVVKRETDGGTTYDAAICERVMKLGREGKSPAQIRADLRILNSQWASRVRHYPDFKEAVEEACWLALAHWESVGMAGMHMGARFNAQAFVFLMKNRFRNEYRDKHEHEVTELRPIEIMVSPAEAKL